MAMTVSLHAKIPKWMSMTMYVTLGWLGAFMAYWLLAVLGWGGFGLFFLGGVFFTVGGYVYSTEQPNPVPGKFGFHEIWHIFVVLGAATHWLLMYCYVLPWKNPANRV
jgi:hemolysin III